MFCQRFNTFFVFQDFSLAVSPSSAILFNVLHCPSNATFGHTVQYSTDLRQSISIPCVLGVCATCACSCVHILPHIINPYPHLHCNQFLSISFQFIHFLLVFRAYTMNGISRTPLFSYFDQHFFLITANRVNPGLTHSFPEVRSLPVCLSAHFTQS